MNLSKLENKTVLKNVENIAARDRANLTTLLHYLREIDRRRLFCDLGYSSLYDFVVRHLKYSEDQAFRRISAARLLKEIPMIENKIRTGALTLTNVTIAENLFRRERRAGRGYSTPQKLEFLRKIENKSSREAERTVATVSPEIIRADQMRPVSESQIEYRFTVSVATAKKVDKLKGMLGHSHPGITLGELLDYLCDIQIERLDKSAPAAPRVKPDHGGENIVKPLSRAAVRRQVWARDGACCVNCKSQYAVEIDHIVPKAVGGTDTLDNLRLLCRKCNQRAAIKVYGQEKMDQHLRSPSVEYRVTNDDGPSPPAWQ